MSKFVMFFNYTSDTWGNMIKNPSDRLEAVRASARSVGGDVESLYFMLGKQDGFLVIDAPDAASAAAVSIAVTSTGAVSNLETHELIASSDLPTVLEKAGSAQGSYRPPGT
jgi:uncharacterized protein with GYD domain